MLFWSVNWSCLIPVSREQKNVLKMQEKRKGWSKPPSQLLQESHSLHWLRYILGERGFLGGEIVNSDFIFLILSCTVIAMLLVYNEDLALNTFCLLTFRFWLLQNDTVLQESDCVSVRKCVLCYLLCSFRLYSRSLYRPFFKSFNFYLQLHIPCTFHWDLLGEPVKITTENTQGWWHRTGGSPLESPVSRTRHKMTDSRITFHWGGVKI